MASSTASLGPAAALLLERLGLRVAPTDAADDQAPPMPALPLPGLLPLRCAVQHYEWGRRGADSLVARLAGEASASDGDGDGDGRPCAELWMGTHPAAPSSLAPDVSLRDWVARNPAALGRDVAARWGGDLPFLFKVRVRPWLPFRPPFPFPFSRAPSIKLKRTFFPPPCPLADRSGSSSGCYAQVLSVAKALSIQAHPDRDLAAALHALRPATYRDSNHKPEMAVAVTEFHALCGFAATQVRCTHDDDGIFLRPCCVRARDVPRPLVNGPEKFIIIIALVLSPTNYQSVVTLTWSFGLHHQLMPPAAKLVGLFGLVAFFNRTWQQDDSG